MSNNGNDKKAEVGLQVICPMCNAGDSLSCRCDKRNYLYPRPPTNLYNSPQRKIKVPTMPNDGRLHIL